VSNEPDYEYPPAWAPPGTEPPLRTKYTPPLRSALGYTGEESTDPTAYPEAWRP